MLIKTLRWRLGFIAGLIVIAGSPSSVMMQTSAKSDCNGSRLLTVKRSLDNDNALYQAIVRNERGDGIDYPWRKKLRALKVRQITTTAEFLIQDKKFDLSLSEIRYYYGYYVSNSLIRETVEIEKDEDLMKQLRMAFFIEGLRLLQTNKIWFNSSGKLYLDLLDDECLPSVYNTSSIELDK